MELVMTEADKQYEVVGPDGVAMGFFLDRRLYDYLTSTCVGFIDGNNQVLDGETRLGYLDGNKYVTADGVTYEVRLKNIDKDI